MTLNVAKAAPTMSWANPADIVYGTALGAPQLNATASVAGTFSYSPAAGTVLNAGSHTLSVTFTPDDAANYNGSSANVTLNVAKATSTMTWPNPADIVYGTALGASQLNATANVAGTFSYSPAAGTVLGAGSHTLAVTFTPDRRRELQRPSANVTLNVTKAATTVSWSTPAGIVYGAALGASQLNATANVAGTFSYSPAAGAVLERRLAHAAGDVHAGRRRELHRRVGERRRLTAAKAASALRLANPAGISLRHRVSGRS